jgi:hypothetical protein
MRIGGSMLNHSDDTFDRADKLMARAERYRLLAEILCDPNIAAVAEECARELETEARAQAQMKSPGVTRKGSQFESKGQESSLALFVLDRAETTK